MTTIISGRSDIQNYVDLGSISKVFEIDIEQEIAKGIDEFPRELGKLENLKGLAFRNFDSVKLPEAIGSLVNLTQLALSGNQLDTLPPSLGQLTQLTRLQISHNQLTTLSDSPLAQLTQLQNLWLDHNKFLELPEYLGTFENLKIPLANRQFQK